MDISELIETGVVAANSCRKNNGYQEYIIGQEYEEWLTLAIRFVETNFPEDADTQRFRQIAENANGFDVERFHSLIGILKAFKEYPPIPPKTDILPLFTSVALK